MPPLIEVRGLVKQFGHVAAVSGLDFQVNAGECVGLLGPNGAGKTTTLEILEGLRRPSAGEVYLFCLRWSQHEKELRQRIGVQLQSTRFTEVATVNEVLQLFHSFYENPLTAETVLGRVQLEAKRRARVGTLSGGQQQRLALAVALIGNPELLFLDEPTTGMDPQSRRALWDVLVALKRDGRTILLTTHYLEEAAVLCDRVLIVDHGRLLASGTPAELIARHGGNARVFIRTSPAARMEWFDPSHPVLEGRSGDDQLIFMVREPHRAVPGLLERISQAGAELLSLTVTPPSLEDVFINLTGRALREDGT